MKVFLKNSKKKYDDVGDYNEKTNELLVKKDSIVSKDIREFKGTNSIIKRRTLYVKDDIVLEDVGFKSPSTAANFITGRSSNGMDVWKDINGKSLNELKK